MPRYRMLKVAAGPDGVWSVGDERTLSREIGDALVADQAAVCVDPPATPEMATRSAPETAQGRGARGDNKETKARRAPRPVGDDV